MNGRVTHFKGQGLCALTCASVCVLQVSIHSYGKHMQTIRPVKISSLGHLSTSHKAGNGEMEETGRKERLEEEEGWGRGRETLIRLLVLLVALSLPSTTPFLPRCNTGTHCWTVWIGGAGGLVFQAKQSSHTSSPDHGQISQRI